ncbi:glycosyltransferase family 22 protein [Myriangium duriaei CBS 260.36]|uniref:Mannosyltransferase n=1 Tax=Myriangium duriaei CBS 260.36 TaxID=1168546 RepID=A0A9P4IWE8_9PEZI|nr:glycosyltransferase family 22 protein [Myriangium duriaei CBS 260.36]
MYFRPWQAFVGFAVVNTLAAIYSPILDCDEVYNFWEPTHYLERGNGFQTWEYAPQYAIRTWLYPGAHALIAFFGRIGRVYATKVFQFYFVRLVLGLACAGCEARLYAQISRTFNQKIGLYFAFILITSSGMFHASVAMLPSTFAMYMTMMAMASFADWRRGPSTAEGIMFFGFASVFAWPFTGALILPFMIEEFVIAYYTESGRDLGQRLIYGGSRTIVAGAIEFIIDLAFYRKYVCFPWNIVWYNVVAATSGKGPNIFGTEPWHFYIRNLLLNFNIWFVLGLLAGPLLYYQEFIYMRPATRSSYIRNITFVTPLYIWLAIFIIQPHKEERFMYPIYPAIALNAAIALHISLIHLSSSGGGFQILQYVPARIRLLAVAIIALLAALFGALRTLGTVEAYGAPLSIYKPLFNKGMAHPGDSVCLGKEWYRFPSHYHLPKGVRAKFVRSAFRGLLPGEFNEAHTGFGLFPGAWLPPAGMNDENREDAGKYTTESHCTYFVDSHLPSTYPTGLEPNRIDDSATWQQLKCLPFLDAGSTALIPRLLWVPDWDIIPEGLRRRWGKYCLLKHRHNHKPGLWPPSTFQRPSPQPYPDWSIENTKPLPYRPFRYGPKYNITMGIRQMQWDEWIELDNHYPKFHAEKTRRIRERGSKCCKTAEESRVKDAAVELLEEFCDYLPKRYPSLFQKTKAGMFNRFTREDFDIRSDMLTCNGIAEDPMQLAARMVQDDLAIMFERDDGQYYLLAGSILLAGFWRLEDKFGMPLSEIHTSGDVPGFKEKLEKGMMSFFRRIKPESPVLRNNYFIQVDDELAWSSSIGDEDSQEVSWDTAESNRPIQHHYFRSERQSLRRLPRSGGVVFTIRTYFHPITEICREPYVPGRLASAVRSWGDDVSRYKGKAKYGDVLLKYLDARHREQIRNGLDLSTGEDIRTYPY